MEKKNKKKKKGKEEKSISESLDELIELKRNENSALKKIFESLQKPNDNKREKH
jgi:hypothetical protein